MKIANITYKPYNNRLCQIVINFDRELLYFAPVGYMRGQVQHLDVYDFTKQVSEWYEETFNINIGHIKNSYDDLCFCIPKRKRKHNTCVALKLRFM